MKICKVVLAAGLAMFLFSCNEKKSASVSAAAEIEEFSLGESQEFKDLFTLDYTSERPEPEPTYDKVDLSGKSGGDSDSTSVIPGLRSLSSYKTKYSTKRVERSDFAKTAAQTEPNTDGKTPLVSLSETASTEIPEPVKAEPVSYSNYSYHNDSEKKENKRKDRQGFVKFIDYGNKIMEAQFPHKYLFSYCNATEKSAWRVTKSENPLGQMNWNKKFKAGDEGSVFLENLERNKTLYQEIDLEPLLENGRGSVKIEASIEYTGYDWKDNPVKNNVSEYVNIQVTDLAATARIGINKAVVMVRTMEKNLAVQNAEVSITGNKGLSTKTVRTDPNGIAIIPITKKQRNLITEYSDSSALTVNVDFEGDRLRFKPNSHSTWRSGVYDSSLNNACKKGNATFMFTDRGLYKPGEKVSFKGIDWDLLLGKYSAFTGDYTVEFEKYSYNGPEIFGTIEGKTSASGGFNGAFEIPEDLEPGSYDLKYTRKNYLSDDGYEIIERLYFTVAYFEPLKFQAELTMSKTTAFAGDVISSNLAATYLAGGALGGAEYRSEWYTEATSFTPSSPEAKNYTYGMYDDYDSRKFVSESSGKLTPDGKASFSCVSGSDLKPIPYIYRNEAYVTDSSNQQIAAISSKMVHPASYYIGIARPENLTGFPKQNQELSFPFALVAPTEKLLENTKTVSGELSYELSREYWTYNYQNSVNDSVYERYTKHVETEAEGTISAGTKGRLKVTPKNAGYYTLRISGKDKLNRSAITDYKFYVTGKGASWFSYDDSATLRLTPDQTMYNPGDTAHILLESPVPAGDYLITVEREGIFTEEFRHFEESAQVIDVKIARNYVPIVYVCISSYQPREKEPEHSFGETDVNKPKGFFGVTPLMINPMVRAFSITAETDKKVYRPGEMATVTLTATKGGKPIADAELTVMAADRAVLDLVNYHVPNPIEFFYSKYRFPIYTLGGDSRAMLMDPVTYNIKNLQGGDAEDNKDGEEAERKNFKSTAFFEPVLITGSDGKVSFTFQVPDNLTTFRLTAFGVADQLVALKESEFAVQNPVNVQAVQPRKLRVRDTAECGVLITNLDNKTVEVTVSAAIVSPKTKEILNEENDDGLAVVEGKASIDGKSTHTVKVGSGSTSVVYFDVAAEEAGEIDIVYTVKSDVLNEKLHSPLKIEKSYVFEAVAMTGNTGYFEGKGSETEYLQIPGFAKDGMGEVKVTLDATQLGLLGTSVNYLFDYPYGCMEQQSSRILPLVSFGDYIKVFGMDNKVSSPKSVVKQYFKKWKDIQHKNGGFPYWPTDTDHESFYVSLRIAHIYALAVSQGYTQKQLPINIDSLKSYISANMKEASDYERAFALYTFSIMKDTTLNKWISDIEEASREDLSVASFLGMSYLNFERRDNAKNIAEFLKNYIHLEIRSADVKQPERKDKNRRWCFYHSEAEEKANLLQFLVMLQNDDKYADNLLYSLLKIQQKGYWQSTATTARVLEAICTLIKERKLDTTDFVAKAEIEGKEFVSGNFKCAAAKPVEAKADFNSEILKDLPRDANLKLDFAANGKGTLYYTAEMRYALPDELYTACDTGVPLRYQLFDFETEEEIKPQDTKIALKAGRTYKVKLTVYSNHDRDYLALRVPVPSGAEILDSTFVTSGSHADSTVSSDGYWWWWNDLSSKEIYDNEIQYFWDTYTEGRKEIEFTFRAARRGVYPVTPVQAECMYEPEIFGRTDGYLFTIE
ncbi:MAG: alpha-2-macroglobulin [Treponema sp.]|nr:alpha-2-macroglobulin [Candidatus Treponema equifaecale]